MSKELLISAILVVIVAIIDARDWCTYTSCGEAHTMCKFKSRKPARRCGRYKVARLSGEEKQKILLAHNWYRRRVASGREHRGSPGPQPAATDLGSLTWDNQLARIAQRWANQCDYGHDECRDVPRFKVGQNVAYIADTERYSGTYEEIMRGLYGEVKLFDRAGVWNFQFDPEIAHYTQIVWADTTRIGCGGIKYEMIIRKKVWHTTYLVCNYGPSGNWVGQSVYQTA